MNCPNCQQPIAGGLFLCLRCEHRAASELTVLAYMDSQTEFQGLPVPTKFEWKGGKLVATYAEEVWLGNRALFNALSKAGAATSARTPKDAIYTVKFHRIDKLASILDSLIELPF